MLQADKGEAKGTGSTAPSTQNQFSNATWLLHHNTHGEIWQPAVVAPSSPHLHTGCHITAAAVIQGQSAELLWSPPQPRAAPVSLSSAALPDKRCNRAARREGRTAPALALIPSDRACSRTKSWGTARGALCPHRGTRGGDRSFVVPIPRHIPCLSFPSCPNSPGRMDL